MRASRFLMCLIAAATMLTLSAPSRAAVLYWDVNGATPGSGNAGGSWAGNNWTTDSSGASDTTGWADGSDAVFSAGSDGTGTWTVDVAAADRSVRNVMVQEGAVTLGASGSFALSDPANWSAAAGNSLSVTRDIANNGHDLSFFSGTNSGGSIAVSGTISGSGSLSVTGPGTLTLSAENSYEGATVIDGGTLKLGHQFGIGKNVYEVSGNLYAQAKGFTLHDGAFDINGQYSYTPSGGPNNWLVLDTITFAGEAGAEMAMIDSGGGGGFGLFSRDSYVGRIVYDATNNPGTATIFAPFSTSGLSGTTTRSIVVGDSSATDIEVDFQGTLGQTGAIDGRSTTIRKEGAGTMQISAANFFPRLHVTGGVLIANHDQAMGVSRSGGLTNLLTLQGGTLQAGGADRSFDTPIALVGSGTISGDDVNLTLSGNITGSGSLVKSGTKTLVLAGTNNYTGNTAIDQGMLSIPSTSALPGWDTAARYSVANGATLTVGTGVLESQVTTMLGTGSFKSGSRLGFDTTAGDRTHAASISGPIGVTKLGSGTLTLGGSNSYTGDTTILEGTLKLGHALGIGTVAGHARGFTLRNGTFDINGQSTYLNSWLLLSDVTLGGVEGTEMTIAGTGGGFGLHNNLAGNEARIIYDATNNPGTATISAAFSTSGSSSNVDRYIIVGDSSATDIEVDFTGTLGKVGHADGRNTTIRKEGAGTMRISAANYFPRLHVAGGVLIANHDQALGVGRTADGGAPNLLTLSGGTFQAAGADRSYAAAVSLSAGTTSAISGDDVNLTLSGSISGAGSLIKSGTKNLTLSGSNSYTGNASIHQGMLAIATTASLPGWNTAGRYLVADGATLTVRAGVSEAQVAAMLGTGNFQDGSRLGFDTTDGDRTHTPSISGPIGLTKLGSGTLTLSGDNSYAGTTIIEDGTLRLGHKFGIGKNSYVYNNATYYRAKGFTLREGTFDFNGMYDYSFSGLNTLLVLDTITLGGKAAAEMTVADSAGGGGFGLFLIGGHEGRIVYDATNNPGTATVSARLSASGTGSTTTRYIVVGDSSATNLELDFIGTLGQVGHSDGQSTTIRKEGAGTMQISAANHFPRLHVVGGALVANHDQALGVSRTGGLTNLLTLQGGTLQAAGTDRSFSTPVTLYPGTTSTISGDDVNLALSGVIGGSGHLRKAGTKSLVLSGDNLYTGNTLVEAGLLLVNNTSGTGTGAGAVTVGPDGTLGGMGTIGGPVTIAASGMLAPGNSVGTLTLNNSLTLAAGSLFDFELGAVGQSDMVWMPTSELILNDQQFDDFTFTPLPGFGTGKYVLFSAGIISGSLGANIAGTVGGLESTLGIAGSNLVLTVVPEPGALGLLAAGLLSLLACGRRKGTFRS